MRVLLVTTWDQPCGIAEHSAELRQAVTAADPTITIEPSVEALSPSALKTAAIFVQKPDLVHLNYQGSLHSRWTPAEIKELQQSGVKVVVTYHDTGVPNSDQCKAICAAADAFVVHEPYTDLEGNGHYWRMGVPAASGHTEFGQRGWRQRQSAWRWTPEDDPGLLFKGWPDQPVLGSIGFPFPWKNFDLLARITRDLGWALLLIAPTATPEQVAAWKQRNPDSYIRTDFVPRAAALGLLTGCDATAFPYVCHNTGQSGAILQGIATRKPVYAFSTCRQFRALHEDNLGSNAIGWAETVDELKDWLRHCPIVRVDPLMVALAEQDSWRGLGQRYAQLYQEVVGG